TSGASPEFSAVWSLPSMSSFWMDCTAIVTPGFASSNIWTVSSQYALPGPVVELCQNVIWTSTASSSAPPSPPVPPSPPSRLQAAKPATLTTKAAVAARVLRAFMKPALLVEPQRTRPYNDGGRVYVEGSTLATACQSMSI